MQVRYKKLHGEDFIHLFSINFHAAAQRNVKIVLWSALKMPLVKLNCNGAYRGNTGLVAGVCVCVCMWRGEGVKRLYGQYHSPSPSSMGLNLTYLNKSSF